MGWGLRGAFHSVDSQSQCPACRGVSVVATEGVGLGSCPCETAEPTGSHAPYPMLHREADQLKQEFICMYLTISTTAFPLPWPPAYQICAEHGWREVESWACCSASLIKQLGCRAPPGNHLACLATQLSYFCISCHTDFYQEQAEFCQEKFKQKVWYSVTDDKGNWIKNELILPSNSPHQLPLLSGSMRLYFLWVGFPRPDQDFAWALVA